MKILLQFRISLYYNCAPDNVGYRAVTLEYSVGTTVRNIDSSEKYEYYVVATVNSILKS